MTVVLALVCALLVVLNAVTARAYRRRLRIRRELADEVLARLRTIMVQHDAFCRDYRDASARLQASYADALAQAEQRWAGQLAEVRREHEDSLDRLRVQQAAALARLQRGLPQPRVLRLEGDQRP